MNETDLAAGSVDDDDVRTLAAVAALYDRADPVPDGLIDRLKFGLTLDALQAEVAELQHMDALAGVRSDSTSDVQTVTFTSSTLTTMVTITPTSPDEARIDGWIAPGAGVEVELRLADRSLRVVADEDGRFVFDAVPRGLARFVLRKPEAAANSRPVVTPSIEV